MDINKRLPHGNQSRHYKAVDDPSEGKIEITCNLIKRAANGDQRALMVFNRFGVSVVDARGNTKNRNRIIQEIAIAKEMREEIEQAVKLGDRLANPRIQYPIIITNDDL